MDTGTDLRLYPEWDIDGDVLSVISKDNVIFLARVVINALSDFWSEKLGLLTVVGRQAGALRLLADAHEVDIIRICASFCADAENGSRVGRSAFCVHINFLDLDGLLTLIFIIIKIDFVLDVVVYGELFTVKTNVNDFCGLIYIKFTNVHFFLLVDLGENTQATQLGVIIRFFLDV